ncbi:MAG: hypothetical protein C5B59_10960 [Bacteroidetes bacterium]|nr:MAG: hypothetical protein C5B59_10960 [Bacteroidota bacterium]
MITYLPAKFLQEKISELQTALFFTDSDSVIKMPTHVISEAEADENGNIWFIVPKPSHEIGAFEDSFPVKLDFFKKGKEFYIKITGTGTFVADGEELQGISKEFSDKLQDNKTVAIKVKVQNADYFENQPRQSKANWLVIGTNHIYNWLFNSDYDYRNPQLAIPIPIEPNRR